MTIVLLGLGSNVGDRGGYLRSAAERINQLPHTRIVQSSHVYETEPVGDKDQADFLNLVIEVSTALAPEELHRELQQLETLLGRTTRRRWGPRELDIDILYFGSAILKKKNLHIPHPERSHRRFVLEPLAELAPDFKDPESGRSVWEMLRDCPDHSSVRRSSVNHLDIHEE